MSTPGVDKWLSDEMTHEARVRQPIICNENDVKLGRSCDPREIFRDERFREILWDVDGEVLALFDRVFEDGESWEQADLKTVAEHFALALSRFNKKIVRLEGEGAKALDPRDLGATIENAAGVFFERLLALGYRIHEQAEIQESYEKGIRGMIAETRTRMASVGVLPIAALDAEVAGYWSLAGMDKLKIVSDIQAPPMEAPLYFGGSKRSDLAACTNGEHLIANLEALELDPKEYEVLCLKLSGHACTMVVPKNSQGMYALTDLFEEVAVILSSQEIKEAPDVFFLGMPNEVFEGVKGIVQWKDGGLKEVEGEEYKRVHYTREDGSMVFVVGAGHAKNPDGTVVPLDYFGPWKKAPFQESSHRIMIDAVSNLAELEDVAQPADEANSPFRYPVHDKKKRSIMEKREVRQKLRMPFHGTTVMWSEAGLSTDITAEKVRKNVTRNHLVFEGQSGMGKSEMEQFIRTNARNLRMLYQIMKDSENREAQRLANGLKKLLNIRLFSGGDDMGVLYFNEEGELKARTHEKGRFTRTDNIPKMEDFEARDTLPLGEDGRAVGTTNTRVIQRDPELEVFSKIPFSVRNFALASNLPLAGAPDKPVQKVSFAEYMKAFADYANVPNGTKDTTDPVNSPSAGHEFFGQFTVAGGVKCENLAKLREAMLREAMLWRQDNSGERQMGFYVINSGIVPVIGEVEDGWISREDYDGLSKNERQKVHFAHTARHWMSVNGLLPTEVKACFGHAEKVLGINLAELAYKSENMSEAELRAYMEQKAREIASPTG